MRLASSIACIVVAIVPYNSLAALGSRLQAATAIPSKPSCSTCRLTLRLTATIKDEPRRPVWDPRPFAVVHQAGTGNYIVLAADLTVLLFDHAGNVLKTVGRQGRGPGEFGAPVKAARGKSDTVFVIDFQNSRISSIAANGEVSGVGPFPPSDPHQFVALPSGDFIMNAVVRERNSIGYPLHLLGRDGRIKRSFGSTRPSFRPDAPPLWLRRLGGGSDSDLWVAREHEYVLEHWRVDGTEPEMLMRRDIKWFPPEQRLTPPTPTHPPPSYVADLRESGDGLLWVLVTIADDEWREGLEPTPDTAAALRGVVLYRTRDYDRLHDSVLELVDPVNSRLVLSQRFDKYFLAFADDGFLTSYRETDDGAVVLEIYQVVLSGWRK